VPETTGRQIVVFAEADDAPDINWQNAGISNVADSRDFAGGDVSPDTLNDESRPVLSVSPELVHHVLHRDVEGYARAYRDGVDDLAARLLNPEGAGTAQVAAPSGSALFEDTSQATWGIQATKALSSPRSGRGMKVAVLDTGFDLDHPDFVGRNVTAQSFVAGESAQDGHGHGTHCIGTACGPRTPSTGPRYGVAYEAEIFAGKVLSNSGSGTDAGILAGINWAVANRCPVISMSLGAPVPQAHPPYSAAGRRALQRGSLIIAAAGNNADRRAGNFGFVGAPANSVEIMAVGALDMQLGMAYFSARSLPGRGGLDLWATLCAESERLLQPSLDVGTGLALAPQ
jgi:subtilisin family serine protease